MTTHQDTSTERDLVERMRSHSWVPLLVEAADEIERLRDALASRDEAAQQPQGQPITERDDFLQGVCVALQVVTAMDCGVTWREIVKTVGKEAILQFAAHDEPEEWELAGFKRYARTELKCGKPNRQPYVMTSREQAALGRALHKSVRFVDEPQGQAVSDEQIASIVRAVEDKDKVPSFSGGFYTLTPEELSAFTSAILSLRDKPTTAPDGTPNNAV